jgi:cell wall-associated protease
MKKVCIAIVLLAIASINSLILAQATSNSKDIPKGWHLLDKTKDGYYGISIEKAYQLVRAKKIKSNTVIVAVLDGGVDTLHEDLKEVLWKNPKEIPGNGIDDDKNGYVDDIYGWNFLGGKDGKNVTEDSYEAARVYHRYKEKFKTITTPNTLTPEEKEQYMVWLKAKKNVDGGGEEIEEQISPAALKRAFDMMKRSDSILQKSMGKLVYTGNELEKFSPTTNEAEIARFGLLTLFQGNKIMESTNKEFIQGFTDFVADKTKKDEAREKAPKTYRQDIVKDNEADINDTSYGNNDVTTSTARHGTHVAGTIAAKRGNGKGMDGIADNVRIMCVRVVPDGDEHDKDIALGIRYAVNNGAKIINMSFGKSFSPDKKWIDEAVKYAEAKGVLLVHAAGNDNSNADTSNNFPNANLTALKTKAANWITVGASGDPKDEGLAASFSNFGKKEVDVFAPGVKIYATVPGNSYENMQGTSMAAPVVAGTAAFLLSYFPTLTPLQLKAILEKSIVPVNTKVAQPGSGGTDMVSFNQLCKTGGIINAYEAVKLAVNSQAPNKTTTISLPPSRLKKGKNG